MSNQPRPHSLTIRLSDEEYALLDYAAQKGEFSMAGAIREALRVFSDLGSITFMPIDWQGRDCRIIHTKKLVQIVQQNGTRWDLVDQLSAREFCDSYLLLNGRWKPIAAFDIIPHDAVMFGSLKEE